MQNRESLITLCRSGCGFYGNSATDGLCSKCYKEAMKKQQSALIAAAIPATTAANATSANTVVGQTPSSAVAVAAAVAAAAAATSLSSKNLSLSVSLKNSASINDNNGDGDVIVDNEGNKVVVQGTVIDEDDKNGIVSSKSLNNVSSGADGIDLSSTILSNCSSSNNDSFAVAGGIMSGQSSTSSSFSSSSVLAAAAATVTSADPLKPKKQRCLVCRKKLGLTGFECRCGGNYCGLHRYSDKHGCTFDYRELGAQEIRKNNPVVKSEKIQKI